MADAILAQSGIYKITNTVNGKVYVGSAVNVAGRWSSHRSHLRSGIHCNARLQRAWDKHGEHNFVFSIIEPVEQFTDLVCREQRWLDEIKPWHTQTGYNICRVAGSSLGRAHTEQTRKKISLLAQGRTLSIETRAKISAAGTGRKMPPETKEKLRIANTGRKMPLAHLEKLREINRGRKLTEAHEHAMNDATRSNLALEVARAKEHRRIEAIERRAASNRGLTRSIETREKMAYAARNRTSEHNAHIAAAMTGKKLSAESIAKREATRAANGANIPTAETRKRRSDALTGVKKSAEHIAKSVAAKRANRLARALGDAHKS